MCCSCVSVEFVLGLERFEALVAEPRFLEFVGYGEVAGLL